MLMDKVGKINTNTKIFVSVSTVMLVAIAMYNWAVSPQTSYLQAAQRYETMMSDTGEKTTVIKNGIDDKKKELERLYEEITATKDSFFTLKTSREFFSDIAPILSQSGCMMESLTFMPSSTVSSGEDTEMDSGISEKRAAIVLTGQYENIIKFLRRLSGYSQHIMVNDLVIESLRSGGKRLVCHMTITIYLIEEKEIVTDV